MHLHQELEPTPASQAVFMVGHHYCFYPGIVARAELVRPQSSELSLTSRSFEGGGVHLQLSLKEYIHLSNPGISILDP